MTKAQMLETIAKQNPDLTKKQVASIVDQVFATMATSIKRQGRAGYPGFGSFELRRRKARKGRNPQTGESIKIKASKTVGFKPAKALKERL